MAAKRILTKHEAVTDARLQSICQSWGARVFSKVRLADVLPVEDSGIDATHFSFALKSHFDFVVADGMSQALFAVELDDPSHDDCTQANRDAKKNTLCQRFEFPLLRVNSRYLQRKYGSMDLLGWFIHTWFATDAMCEAQKQGLIAPDEPIDPTFSFNLPGETGKFPLWLSRDVAEYVRDLAVKNKFCDPGISAMIGRDQGGAMHAIGYIRLTANEGAFARTGMQSQNFPVDLSSVLEDIVVREAYEKLSLILAGDLAADGDINNLIDEFQEKYDLVSASTWSRPSK